MLIAILSAVNERSNAVTDEEYALSGAPQLFPDDKGAVIRDGVVFGAGKETGETDNMKEKSV